MASVERTGYPRFKNSYTQKELKDNFTPKANEIEDAYSVARGTEAVLGYVILLKCFQHLGYFPKTDEISESIINHIKKCTNINTKSNIIYNNNRTLYTHQKAIRLNLHIIQYDDNAESIIIEAVTKATQTMNNPADLINVAIDVLIKNNYELPAYSTIERIALSARTSVNNQIFSNVQKLLTNEHIKKLDSLLETRVSGKNFSEIKYIKDPAKRPSFNNLKELMIKLNTLDSFGDFEFLIENIPFSKLKHFYEEAKILDASELRKYSSSKRYTYLAAFLSVSKAKLRDTLIETFLRCVSKIHQKGREELELIREKYRSKSENIINAFSEVLNKADECCDDSEFGKSVRELIDTHGGKEILHNDCDSLMSYNGNNYHILLPKYFSKQRSSIYKLINILELNSTTEDQSLINALKFINENHKAKRPNQKLTEIADINIDLSFVNTLWEKAVLEKRDGKSYTKISGLEACIFSNLASDIKTGDVYIKGSESYADYREQLLDWDECVKEIPEYCSALGIGDTPESFVNQLKEKLTKTAEDVDNSYPGNSSLVIEENGEPILKKYTGKGNPKSVQELEDKLFKYIPERTIIEILCNTQHWTNWSRHYGPISGSDPKLENPIEKYIALTFGYGCNLGPVETSKHIKGTLTPHVLSYINRRHVTPEKQDAALRDLINKLNSIELPSLWGSGKISAADGTMLDLYGNNMTSEYHIRYGGNGGIAYHLISDTYIAILGTFIPCGAWEGIYLIDLFMKNKSEIQPDTVHGDTQAQTGTVFALAYLLGINLMPRIRNWKSLKFYRPEKSTAYKHIDSLFKDTVNWNLIKIHWKDFFQIVMSIKAGKILPSTLLRKLNNESKKNKLFLAFRELGMVIRTIFMLKYISDKKFREQINSTTNKMEAYNGFIKWFLFGGDGIIKENDPVEQEKRIKYNDIIANSVILSNVVDITNALKKLSYDGYELTRNDIASLSPYITRHIKRFGDYTIDIKNIPDPIDGEIFNIFKN